MTKDLIARAVALAGKRKASCRRKRYLMAAVGQRVDGPMVFATNHSDPSPQPSGHAEARLARKLDYGSIVAVARVTRDGLPAMARPCARCLGALRARGVRLVVYTAGPDRTKNIVP